MPRPRVSVLLVDDQALIGEAVRRMLATQPAIDFRYCSEGSKAVEAARSFAPTVILQDLVMPDANGLELLEAYRSDDRLRDVPVIVLSAKEEASTKAEAFARGASDYLVKLPDPVELLARIHHHSAGFVAERERQRAFAELSAMERQVRDKNRRLDEANRRLEALNADLAEDVREGQDRLESIAATGAELSRIQDLDILLERILGEAGRFADAAAGAILVRRGDALLLEHRLARGIATHEPGADPISISMDGLAGRASMTGDVVHATTPSADSARPGFVGDLAIEGFTAVTIGSALALPLRTATAEVLGVLVLVDSSRGFPAEDLRLLAHFASLATVAMERASLTRSMILRMIGMAELRDPTETGTHVQRVAGYSIAIFSEWARRHSLDPAEAERQRDLLRIAAMLHDVGKVGIPDAILKKPGKLDDAEFARMQTHTVIGANLFAGLRTEFDAAAREVALRHHERWDGGGYPGPGDPAVLAETPPDAPIRAGLAGEAIPLFARIVGLADVFDALSSKRSYKESWPESKVLDVIRSESGRHFDPELVEILLDRIDELRAVRDRFGD
ncbi:MAG: HD domain-containing phosphohydrolase [Phycisphaerales bacterium]